MVRGRGLKLPSVLRFTILSRSVGMNLALAPPCRFELVEMNARNSWLFRTHAKSSLTCSMALSSPFSVST